MGRHRLPCKKRKQERTGAFSDTFFSFQGRFFTIVKRKGESFGLETEIVRLRKHIFSPQGMRTACACRRKKRLKTETMPAGNASVFTIWKEKAHKFGVSFCKAERPLGLRISCPCTPGIQSPAIFLAAGCPWQLAPCFLQTPRESRICRGRP